MPSMLVHEGTYFSPLDEDAFFRWLGSIPGVRKITGTPNGLLVLLRAPTLSEPALREMIAIHWRYKLPMRDLRGFKTEKNECWFCDQSAFWFEAVFGKAAVPANMEFRLAELRNNGLSPVQAIKIIHKEYRVGLNEAKRRLSLSPSWATLSAASVSIQGEAVAIAIGGPRRSSRGAA